MTASDIAAPSIPLTATFAGRLEAHGHALAVATDAGDVLTYTRVVAERTATPVRSPVATIEVDYIDVPLMAADVAQTGLGD